MKKIKKNFMHNSFSIESMTTLATCECSRCTSGYCQCNTVSDYGGYYYSVDVPYVSLALKLNTMNNE